MGIFKGAKHTCQSCNTKFYDMGVKNAKCPNCLLEIIKKNEGKNTNHYKFQKEDKIEIETRVELLEVIDPHKGTFRNTLDKPINFENADLFSNSWYVIEKKYISNDKVEKDAPFLRLETSPERGLISFLSSNHFKGIGNVQAENLVKNYGFSFVRFLNNKIKKISLDFQISESMAKILIDGWKKTERFNLLEILLRDLNFKFSQIKVVRDTIGSTIISSFKKEPYALIDIIPRLSFDELTTILLKLGIVVSDEQKILAATNSWLKDTEKRRQHTCAPVEKTLTEVSKMTDFDKPFIEKCLRKHKKSFYFNFHKNIEIIVSEISYKRDKDVLKELKRLKEKFSRSVSKKVFNRETLKAGEGIDLSTEQISAINLSINSSLSIITGGPGSGKTTLVRAMVMALKDLKLKIKLCAPTGRAARRISENPGLATYNPSTIHRYLYSKKKGAKDNFDVMIVDESSMIDINLFLELLLSIPDGTGIIFIGDSDQLPPVSAGQPFNDLIKSEKIPVSYLTGNFRQKELSPIVNGARDVILGYEPKVGKNHEDSDFYFLENTKDYQSDVVIKQYLSVLPDILLGVEDNDIQILSPMRKGSTGINNLNKIIQQHLTAKGKPVYEKKAGDEYIKFYLFDKVMMTQNDYEIDVMNGDIGKIIRKIGNNFIVVFEDGNEVEFTPENRDKLDLAYAITIHKSQGSEYRAVVIPVSSNHIHMLTRKLLYTGITRGKEMVCLVGEKQALKTALQIYKQDFRYTNLSYQIQKNDF